MAALVVPCPQCATRLSAPESAVGKQIRCPRCGGLATVPELLPVEEVPVVEAKVVPTPQRTQRVSPPPVLPKKPITVVDPTEDRSNRESLPPDEDEDERPRKKKRPRYLDDDDYDHDRPRRQHKPRRKSGGGGGMLAAGLVIGLMFALAAVGFAVYFFAGKGKDALAKRAPVPADWEQHNYPQDGFQAYLPPGASYTSIPADGFRPGAGRGGRFGPGGFGWDNDLPPLDRIAVVKTNDWNASVQIELIVVKFRDRIPSSARGQLRNGLEAKFGDSELRQTRWLGHDATEQIHPGGIMRVVYTDRHLVVALVNGANGGRAKPEEEAGFFDNLEITN